MARTEQEWQDVVAARLEMFARIDPEGAELIRSELASWHDRSMRQADTIGKLLRDIDRLRAKGL